MKMRKLTCLPLLIALALMSGCGTSGGGGNQMMGPPALNALNGQYAFLLSGFDPAGSHPMGVIGSLTADGMGHITGGSVDVNDNQILSSSSSALAGSYTLNSNFRGTITLTNTVGSVTHPLAFAFTLKADGTFGNMIDVDANNFVLSGTMQKQDGTAFSLAKLAGDFAFEVDSRAPSQRTVLGRLTLGQDGTSSKVVLDGSISGFGFVGPETGGPASIMFASAGPNGSGRGTLSLTDSTHGTANFDYYVVNAGTFLALEADPANITPTIFAGSANKQSTPFTATTVNTAASVFALTGFDVPAPNDMAAVGLLQITGSNTASLLWDTDDFFTIFSQVSRSGQTITFDPSTGRGTITIASGFANGLFDTGVFYLTTSGNGFLADATPSTSNRALAGRIQTQSGSGSFAATDLSGNMIMRQTGLSVAYNGALDALFSQSTNGNTLTGTVVGDFQSLNNGSSFNQTSSLTAATVAIDQNTGRGTLTFPGNGFTNTNVFYLIGKNQYVLTDETPEPNNVVPIEFHDPQ